MNINAETRLYCIFGNPVKHSLSPVIHNAAFRSLGINAVYLAFQPAAIEAAIGAMRTLDIQGASVTIPFKVDALRFCDEVDPLAEKIGSINTLHREGSRIIGYNTDGEGALKALAESGASIRGAHVLVLGNGGSARAIAFTLLERGASVTIAGRNRDRIEALAADLHLHYPAASARELSSVDDDFMSGVDIIVNTTPVGMAPDTGRSPLDVRFLLPRHTVFDIVYAPDTTALLRGALDRGCRTVRGIAMLTHQALRQFEIWTGLQAPADEIQRALAGRMRQE